MARASSQKFIARNRAPRVQIEYDVELYGAEKKIQLPFVMGVMANLSGKPAEALPDVADRKFLDIDVDNFDQRLKAMKPRVAFQVPNTLTGDGNLMVDITFESMDDFSPAAVARKVDALRKLLEARQQLANLLTYMDGKTGAEQLIQPGAAGSGAAQGRWPPPRSRPRPRRTPSPSPNHYRRGHTMATQQQTEGQGGAVRGLRARAASPEGVQAAVRRRQGGGGDGGAHPGRAGARADHADLVGRDRRRSRRSIAALDRKLTEQVNLIMHHKDFQEAGGRLARAPLPGDQHRDRRDAEDPRDEHLEGGPRPDAQALQGHRLGPEPDLQEDLRGRSTGSSAASPSAAWSATTTSTTRRRTSSCSARWRRSRAAAHCPFIAGVSPSVMQMESWQELANPRDLTKIFTHAGVRPVALAARVRGLALHRPGDAAVPGPLSLRQDQPGRGVRLPGGHRRRRATTSSPG